VRHDQEARQPRLLQAHVLAAMEVTQQAEAEHVEHTGPDQERPATMQGGDQQDAAPRRRGLNSLVGLVAREVGHGCDPPVLQFRVAQARVQIALEPGHQKLAPPHLPEPAVPCKEALSLPHREYHRSLRVGSHDVDAPSGMCVLQSQEGYVPG
jgi:hypothetical protein